EVILDDVVAKRRPHWNIHYPRRLDHRCQPIGAGIKTAGVSVGELHSRANSATVHRSRGDLGVDRIVLLRPQQSRRLAGGSGGAAESYALRSRRTTIIAKRRVLFLIYPQLVFYGRREIPEVVDALDVLRTQPNGFHLSFEEVNRLVPDSIYLPF